MVKACLDTGIIALFYSKDPSESILKLMKEIKEGKIEAYIVLPILQNVISVEPIYHYP